MAELSKIKVELNLFSLVGQKVNNAECSCITVQLHANNHIGLDDKRKQTRCGSALPLNLRFGSLEFAICGSVHSRLQFEIYIHNNHMSS